MFFPIIYELFFVDNYAKIKYQNFKGYLLTLKNTLSKMSELIKYTIAIKKNN